MSKANSGFEINKLRFVVLPGNPGPDFAHRELYDQAYRHYKQVWKRTFDRRAGLGVFDPYAFLRQSFVFLINHEATIVAQLCGTFLNLNSEITHDLSYFSNFKGRALEIMQEEGARNLMTLEFSSVNPEYSPRRIGGLCLGEVMSRLGYMYAMTFAIDLTTGLPRRLSGTNEKILQSGYRLAEESRTRCGLSVDVVLGFRDELVPHPDSLIRSILATLWDGQMDLTKDHSSMLANGRPTLKKEDLCLHPN